MYDERWAERVLGSPENPRIFQKVVGEKPVVRLRLLDVGVVHRVRVCLLLPQVHLVLNRCYSSPHFLLRELLPA